MVPRISYQLKQLKNIENTIQKSSKKILVVSSLIIQIINLCCTYVTKKLCEFL